MNSIIVESHNHKCQANARHRTVRVFSDVFDATIEEVSLSPADSSLIPDLLLLPLLLSKDYVRYQQVCTNRRYTKKALSCRACAHPRYGCLFTKQKIDTAVVFVFSTGTTNTDSGGPFRKETVRSNNDQSVPPPRQKLHMTTSTLFTTSAPTTLARPAGAARLNAIDFNPAVPAGGPNALTPVVIMHGLLGNSRNFQGWGAKLVKVSHRSL